MAAEQEIAEFQRECDSLQGLLREAHLAEDRAATQLRHLQGQQLAQAVSDVVW